MNVNIGEYYEAKLRAIIARGVASNKTEALRMAINAYEKQLEEEHEILVVEKLRKEVSGLKNEDFVPLEQVLKEAGIKKEDLE